MVSEDYIQQGLVQRGLPSHIAQGFVMNMKDESGLNPGISEVAPIVPGSRGGFGLYQLTGPRRRAYEAYAESRGVALDNADAQLDFLMTELQGPEKRAAQSIFSTKTPQDAAVAIARDFLRPSPSNLQKRVSRYAGGRTPEVTTGIQGSDPMMQQQRPRGLLEDFGIQKMQEGAEGETGQRFYNRDTFKDRLADLAVTFGKMGIMGLDEPAAALVNRRAARRDKNKTVEYLTANGREDLAEAVRAGTLTPRDAAGIMFAQPKEFELQRRARLAGLVEGTPEYKEFMLKGGNLGKSAPAQFGAIPSGYQLRESANEKGERVYQMVPVAGGPADTTISDEASMSSQAGSGSTVLADIGEMKRRVKESPTLTTGFIGSILKNIGGTGALDVNQLGETIRSNIGFDRLQRMREESPTGGALGQVAVQELNALQASLGSLLVDQSDEQLLRNLERLELQYKKSMRRILETEGGDKYFSQPEIDMITSSSKKRLKYNPNTGEFE